MIKVKVNSFHPVMIISFDDYGQLELIAEI